MLEAIKVIVTLPTGVYYGTIMNFNEYREPDLKYAIQVHAYKGFVPQDGVIFAGVSSMTKLEVL